VKPAIPALVFRQLHLAREAYGRFAKQRIEMKAGALTGKTREREYFGWRRRVSQCDLVGMNHLGSVVALCPSGFPHWQ